MASDTSLDRVLRAVRIDFRSRHQQPTTLRLILATIASLVGSLLADMLIVAIGKALFPHTTHYGHFQFSDYAKLTIIGVLIACIGWPIVTRLSSTPRWVFVRLAVVVTLVLWLPDIYILHQGQSGQAVGVLMVMHVAIAIVTYNALVRIAPVVGTSVPTSPKHSRS